MASGERRAEPFPESGMLYRNASVLRRGREDLAYESARYGWLAFCFTNHDCKYAYHNQLPKGERMRTVRRSVLEEILDKMERRRHVRFLLDADVKVVSDRVGLLPGQSFDISESGMSVLLPLELSLGEVVRLIFTLPMGAVEVDALVRSRNAFRHGFEFVAEDASQVLIRRSCEFLTPCPYES